jgi:hypothetical protein
MPAADSEVVWPPSVTQTEIAVSQRGSCCPPHRSVPPHALDAHGARHEPVEGRDHLPPATARRLRQGREFVWQKRVWNYKAFLELQCRCAISATGAAR